MPRSYSTDKALSIVYYENKIICNVLFVIFKEPPAFDCPCLHLTPSIAASFTRNSNENLGKKEALYRLTRAYQGFFATSASLGFSGDRHKDLDVGPHNGNGD